MDQEIVIAVIAIVPQLVLVFLLLGLAMRFRDPLLRIIDQRGASVSAFGIKIDLLPGDVEAAVTGRIGAAGEGSVANAPPVDGERVVARARRLASVLAGRTVLWVDDQPAGNRAERRLLREMGIFTESVLTNAEALAVLRDPAETVDVVISDVKRQDGDPGGIQLIDDIRRLQRRPPVILYLLRLDPRRGTPVGAFGITNRPDELLDLVMDAIERQPERLR